MVVRHPCLTVSIVSGRTYELGDRVWVVVDRVGGYVLISDNAIEIFARLRAGYSVREVWLQLCDMYGIDAGVAKDDVLRFCARLVVANVARLEVASELPPLGAT